ncbi:MAG: DUF4013 domain-containing protein [Acidobacteriota bacterium]
MVLSCPGCHAKHKFRDNLAIDRAIYVRCPECSHMMLISPQINNPANVTPRPELVKEEPVGLPPEIAAAIAATRGNLWRFELLELAKEELDADEVKKLILDGRVGADDLIAHADRNDWKRLDEIVEFAPEIAEATTRRHAAAHRSREEAMDAQEEPEPEAAPEPLPPFWQDMRNVATYPFVGWGVAALGISTAFLMLSVLSRVSIPLLAFNLAYALKIIRESSHGRDVPPGWESFTDIFELVTASAKVLLVTLGAWLPLIVLDGLIALGPLSMLRATDAGTPAATTTLVEETLPAHVWHTLGALHPAAIGGNLVIAVCVFLYYPLCLALLADGNRVLPALMPGRILAALRAAGRAYGVALGTIAGTLAITLGLNWVVATISNAAGLAYVGLAVRLLLLIYTLFIDLHILGRMSEPIETP